MYTNKEMGFILYNNRSINVVKNFIPNTINPLKLIEIEEKFEWCKSIVSDNKMVEINISELDINAPDEIITKEQITELTNFINSNIGSLSKKELSFLNDRGINGDIINKWKILGISCIKEYETLRRIGATCHPILRPLLVDGIEEGGIIIPLFENGVFINCTIRRISDVGKLKYTLACPDVNVWGLHDIIENDEIWITEGIFDMIALRERGKKSISCSSAIWSGIQLYQILDKDPKNIIIFSDNDQVGLRVSLMLSKFFNLYKIENKIVISNDSKDPSEHIFEKNNSMDEISKIKVTKEMIESKNDNSFNFLKHLKNRKF